jgi:hypothetical protein
MRTNTDTKPVPEEIPKDGDMATELAKHESQYDYPTYYIANRVAS